MRPRRSRGGRRPQALLALFCAGMVLFNFPLLIVFDGDATVLGAPLLPVALFAIWAILIGLLAWVMEGGSPEPSDAPQDAAADAASGPDEPGAVER